MKEWAKYLLESSNIGLLSFVLVNKVTFYLWQIPFLHMPISVQKSI